MWIRSECSKPHYKASGASWMGNQGDWQGWMWLSCGLRERQKGCIAAIETEPTQRNNQRNESTENLKIQTSPFSWKKEKKNHLVPLPLKKSKKRCLGQKIKIKPRKQNSTEEGASSTWSLARPQCDDPDPDPRHQGPSHRRVSTMIVQIDQVAAIHQSRLFLSSPPS